MRKSVTRRMILCFALLLGLVRQSPALAQSNSPPNSTLPYLAGVNLAGAEFGERMPGKFGVDYTYPTPASIRRYRQLGFNIIRLPFRWERLQPDPGAGFAPDEWSRLAATMDAARSAELYIILDVHNYARRRLRHDGFRTEHLIGSRPLPVSAFVSFWRELASRTANRPNVIYGLMNEPYDISAESWLAVAQAAANAIRETGARNLLLVPGTAWSGAHSWHRSGNTVLRKFNDPAANWAIDVHQYLDGNSSGRSPRAISATIGVERIKRFQQWARQHKLRAFLGEFGSGSDPTSLAAIENLLGEVNANRDVWLGWSAWAGGPWWPEDDPFALEPAADGTLPPQTRLIAGIARRVLAD